MNSRQQTLIKKYGSLEAYEKCRKEKIRNTTLSKCKTNEEIEKLKKKYEYEDFLLKNNDKSILGKEVICQCGKKFIAKTNTVFCKSCLLKEKRIIFYGSYENFLKISKHNYQEAMLKKYGVDNPLASKEISKKAINTKKQRYGEKLEKIVEKIENTKLEKYENAHFNNVEKAKQTCLEKYGVDNPMKYNEIKESVKQTCLEKYGVDNPRKSDVFIKKAVQKKKKLYGEKYEKIVEKIQQTKLLRYNNRGFNNIEKIKLTNINKYNVPCIFQTEEVKNINRQRLLDNNPMKQEEIKNKMIKSCLANGGFNHKNFFRYNDLIFESSWELYFYLYLLKNNISFIYKPDPLIYIDSNNKSHYYFPDFKTFEYIEIKGDNLITENGILKDFNGNLQEDKTNFLKSLGVKILSRKELEPIFNEIDTYYGKDFVKSHRVIYG